MSQIIPLFDQVESLVANAGTAAEIKAVLFRLRHQCEELERQHATVHKELAGFWEFHTEDIAKREKRHDEHVERLAAEIADLKRGLGDLGQTI